MHASARPFRRSPSCSGEPSRMSVSGGRECWQLCSFSPNRCQARGGLVAEDGALPSSLTKPLLPSRSLTFLSSSRAASFGVSPALSPLNSQPRERVLVWGCGNDTHRVLHAVIGDLELLRELPLFRHLLELLSLASREGCF